MEQKVRTKPYYDELDIIKGIAILTVFYVHSFATSPINIQANFSEDVQNFIENFNMGLFFFVSGFLFSLKDSWPEFLKKKVKRILVPYIVFCCLNVALRNIFSGFTISQNKENIFEVLINGQHYWFLHTIFLILLAMKCVNGRQKYGIPLFIVIILLSFTPLYKCKVLHVNRFIMFFPYVYIGYLMKLYYVDIKKYLSSWLLIAALFVLAITIFHFGKHSKEAIRFAYIPVSVLYVWGFSIKISEYMPLAKKIFCYFGKYSLQYYLNQMLIMFVAYRVTYYISYYGGIHIPVINLVICFLSAIAISTVLLFIEKQHKYLKIASGL